MKDVKRVLRLGAAREGVDEELAYHFDRTVEDLMSSGMTCQDAESEAARRFGDIKDYRSRLQAIDRGVETKRRWAERWDATRQAVQFAARSLSRSPGLSLGVIIAFALGIGANLTMYGVVERLLLRPPEHIVDADAVKRIYLSEYVPFLGDRFTGATLSYPDYRQLRTVTAFEDVAAWAPREVTVGSGLSAVEQRAVYVSGNFFGMLGVQPAHGRFFGEAEDRVGGPARAVLSWTAWQRDFGGGADVIGRTIDFGFGPYEIIGVAPEGFTGVDLAPVDVWLPFHVVGGQMRGSDWMESHGTQFFMTIARLRPDVTEAAAVAEATTAWIAGREGTDFASPEADPAVLLTSVLSARGPDAPPESAVARLLLVVAAIVLLIAALNVANLLLARSLTQRREIAVRLALGISRRRLMGQILLEGMLLAVAGGAAALLVSMWATEVMGGILLPEVQWSGGMNVRIVVLALALSVVVGLAAALIPAVQASRGTLSDTLRQAGAGGVTRGAARFRASVALVQTALSVLLLVGAGLFVRSLDRVRNVDMGFDARNLVYAVPQTGAESISQDDIHTAAARGLELLRRIPGVQHAGVTHSMPFHSFRTTRLRAEGVDSIPIPTSGGPYMYEVSPGFLEAMNLDVVAGRTITDRDAGASQPIVLINQSMADALWPEASPLGRCLYIGMGPDRSPQTRCSEIVGVVEDSRRQEMAAVTTLQYYVPLAQQQANGHPRVFVIRTSDESPATLQGIRRTILETDPRIRYVEAEPMMSRIDPGIRSWRLGAAVFSVFGLLALVVASIGLYSVLAFDVAQRTREIGVRSALGASTRSLLGLVVAQSLRITAMGVAAGAVIALLLAGRVEPLLFETAPRDPLTFAAVILILHLVAVAASSLPAWRASRVDPNVALRSD
ncbi:MAG: ABC transporter permease [Gemmatimonadetes bacterium]|nr:ABC transporter permease [Gemmatimonadota bacterium]